jgi:hypothetical protein
VKRRLSLALAGGALSTSLLILTLPWPVAGVTSDCAVDAPPADVCAAVAPAYVWDGRMAASYVAPAYVWDGRLAASSVAPSYVWDGRLAG